MPPIHTAYSPVEYDRVRFKNSIQRIKEDLRNIEWRHSFKVFLEMRWFFYDSVIVQAEKVGSIQGALNGCNL